jgi:hypothetical protein
VAAASAALARRSDTARKCIACQREIAPECHVADFKNLRPLRHPEDLARYEGGLRPAGLTEKLWTTYAVVRLQRPHWAVGFSTSQPTS